MKSLLLIGVTALALSACREPSAPATPHPSASLPLDDEVVVAVSSAIASVTHPVVWFGDPEHNHSLLAYDWSGKLVGSLRVQASQPFGVLQSPDGTALVLLHARPTSGGTVVGRTRGWVTWAQDAEHLCVFRSAPANNLQGTLFLDTPSTGTSRPVENFGQFSEHGGPIVLSCSVPTDRAIVGNQFVADTSEVHALTLRDATNVGAQGFAAEPARGPQGIVASEDGRFVAVGSSKAAWSGVGDGDTFTIRDVNTGTALATLPGGIVAFSADDSRVLTVTYSHSATPSGVYQLVDWCSSSVLWSAELPAATAQTRPAHGDMLLEPIYDGGAAGSTRRKQFTIPIIVRGDGTAVTLPVKLQPIDY